MIYKILNKTHILRIVRILYSERTNYPHNIQNRDVCAVKYRRYCRKICLSWRNRIYPDQRSVMYIIYKLLCKNDSENLKRTERVANCFNIEKQIKLYKILKNNYDPLNLNVFFDLCSSINVFGPNNVLLMYM